MAGSSAAPANMPTDDPLQRYYIMESLGKGGHGRTFRAVDRDTDRQIAVKVLSLRDLEGWKGFEMFEREVAVLKTLDHPGIPRYIDSYASETTGDYFLAMELVDGRPLSEFVAGKDRLTAKQLRDVFDQLLDILAYLHGLAPAVIHRDIKPANIIMRSDNTVALVDFGGVRRAAKPGGGSTMIGTFGYMAPEQLHGEATAATDLYALAATIASLIAGVDASDLPHDGLRIDIDAIDVPAAMRPVLAGMLKPEPRERLSTVDAVRRALRRPPRAAGPKAGRRPPTSPPLRPQTALAKDVPLAARQLARVAAPFSLLVWIFTALGAGALLVFEVVALRLFYSVGMALQSNDPRGQSKFRRSHEEFKRDVQRSRATLSFIADGTRPRPDRDDRA